MMQFFVELIIHLIITLTLVKIIFNRSDTSVPNKDDSNLWKTAAESMSLLEKRLEQLTARDMRHQERVWALEDLNRDLQNRLSIMSKDGMIHRADRSPAFDDDDDDQDNAIPPNNS